MAPIKRLSPFREKNGMTRALRLLAVSTVLLLIPATTWSQGSAATRPINGLERAALSPSRDMLAQGENVADTACASCHGVDGVSPEPGIPHLAGQRTVYLHRVLQAYQKRERHHDEMNHATGFLNEEALLAVSAYYASLPPARPPLLENASIASVDADGGDPFAEIRSDMKKCVKCHGEDGNASASGMPNLSAQTPDYFVAAMNAYTEDGRDHRMMAKLVAKLDEDTLGKMGVFYAVQKPARTETSGDGNAELGRVVSESCAGCHGDDGNASGAEMPSLAGQDARYFVKAMKAYKDGKRQHQQMFDAVNELSEADVDNLAAFYASQEPLRRNIRTPLTTNEWVDRCERCHGIDGNSTDPRFPMLAGQDPTYLAKTLESYIGATRSNTTMHAMSDPLSAADVERIVKHYATREPKSVVYMQLPCEDLTDE
jgi:cytochrome c553